MEVCQNNENQSFSIILAGRKILGILILEFTIDPLSKIFKIKTKFKSIQNQWKKLNDFSAAMSISQNGWLIGQFDGKIKIFDSRQKNIEDFCHLHLDAIHQFQKLKNSTINNSGTIFRK